MAAVDRAPALYFPNRTHRARIAVKKLRYAIEVAADTGVWQHDRVLKDLRRVQGLLGSVRDAQILVDALDDLLPKSERTMGATVITALLEGEIVRQYARYARRRDRLRQIAAACFRASADAHLRRRFRTSLITASMLTAPVLIEAVGPWSRRPALHG